MEEWDVHRIRKTRNTISPSGKPIIKYNFPELYSCNNYLVHANYGDINKCLEECTFFETPCDEDIYELCQIIISEQNITKPETPDDAVNLYILLKREIEWSLY